MSSIRIGGMVSGMDTDQIVKDLMKVERTRVDKLEQSKEFSTWRQEAYNNLNKDFANFILDTKKDFGLTTTTSAGSLINTSVSSLNWVKGITSSDETIATVSSTSSAIEGSYNITVDSLAENFSAASKSNITTGTDTTSIANQFAGIGAGNTIDFTITTDTGSKTFTYNDLANQSIDDIVNDINSANLGVTASYDSNIDRFFIQTDNTGSENWVKVKDNTSIGGNNFINDTLGLAYDNGGVSTDIAANDTQYSGKDAQIDFGAALDIKQSSNQFSINGINFDLKSIGSFTAKVDTDVDAVYEKISSFVEKYNALIDNVGTKLTEKRYRDYNPLTEEQKNAMSEKEIELWEEKAKSGLLKSDTTYKVTMQNMRNGFYETVEGVTGSFSNIYEIGVTTERYSAGTVGGKLQIDEDKLKEAIRNDVDGVLELLFTQADDSVVDEDQIKRESGLVTRLYDNMVTGMKEVINKSGPGNDSNLYKNVQSNMLIDFVTDYSSISILDKEITNVNRRIDDMNDYLTKVEDRYWQKFSAMESALMQMQSQSDSLMSQLGGM